MLLTTKDDTIKYNPAKGTIAVVSKSGKGKELDKVERIVNTRIKPATK